MINERKLSENELDSRFAAVKGLLKNKAALVKKYGKDAEKVMYGIATKQAKKKVENMNLEKVKEMVEAAISNPKAADLNKDGKLSDYEAKRGAAIEKNLQKEEDVEELFGSSIFDDDEEEKVLGVSVKEESGSESPLLKAKIYADDFMSQYRKMYRIVSGNFGKEAEAEFKKIVKAKFASLQEGSLDESEDLNEGTDLYDRNGIQITRFSGGQDRGLMVQINYGGKYIQVSATDYADLVRALDSVKDDLKSGLSEKSDQKVYKVNKKELAEKIKAKYSSK